MKNTIKFSVDEKDSGKRLDKYLAENINEFTRSFLKKSIKEKQVKLNNTILFNPSTKVKYKDQIIINIIDKNSQICDSKKNQIRHNSRR